MREPTAVILLLAACHHTAALRVSMDMGRRRLLAAAPLLAAPALADTDDDARLASVAEAYSAGARNPGRGANALRKSFASTGVVRTGGITDPLFAAGQVLDELKAADGSAVSVSFAFPEAWGLAKGPNLDVRSVQTADSAFVVVAPLPAGVSDVGALPASFFTGALFAKDGKYGSYGGVDEVAVSKDSTETLSTPTGGSQVYRRLALKFSVRLLERVSRRRTSAAHDFSPLRAPHDLGRSQLPIPPRPAAPPPSLCEPLAPRRHRARAGAHVQPEHGGASCAAECHRGGRLRLPAQRGLHRRALQAGQGRPRGVPAELSRIRPAEARRRLRERAVVFIFEARAASPAAARVFLDLSFTQRGCAAAASSHRPSYACHIWTKGCRMRPRIPVCVAK